LVINTFCITLAIETENIEIAANIGQVIVTIVKLVQLFY
jgi:hypothetical protein